MASSDLRPTLSELGARVKELSETLERLLKESDVKAPTLAPDSPINISKFTPEIFTTKQKLQDAINDLSIISQGPSESVFNFVHNVSYWYTRGRHSVCGQGYWAWRVRSHTELYTWKQLQSGV